MAQERDQRMAMKSIYIMNGFLLTVHSCLFVFFLILNVNLMTYVNVVSVIFYAAFSCISYAV